MMTAAATARMGMLSAAIVSARDVGRAAVLRGGRAHALNDGVGMAVGTVRFVRRIANQLFKDRPALLAFIFVNRHFSFSLCVFPRVFFFAVRARTAARKDRACAPDYSAISAPRKLNLPERLRGAAKTQKRRPT